jgi:hypothetical protein
MNAPTNSHRPLSALALVCSLKRSPAPSSSALMAEHVSEQLRNAAVKTESLRCVDYAISPGVQADMGDGDEWPKIRQKLMDADILVSPASGRCPHSTLGVGRASVQHRAAHP